MMTLATLYSHARTHTRLVSAGDLKTFLLARRHLVNDRLSEESDEISSKKLTQMALDIARALSYLADLKYVHRYVLNSHSLGKAQKHCSHRTLLDLRHVCVVKRSTSITTSP